MTTVLESITRVTPLGVRLWDSVAGRAVTEGIRVRELTRGIPAFPNRAGFFVASGLPGLRASEYGTGDEDFWAGPPVTASFVFEVVDTLGRYHDFRFTAELPHRGAFVPPCVLGSPPGAASSIPLFSTPARVLPGGTAAVRAHLWDEEEDRPAAWAVLEVSAPGLPTAIGVADARGSVLVPLPYPEPPWHGASPPPGSRSLSAQSWTVGLAVRYSPALASPPLPDPETTEPPDLCAVLAQLPARLVASLSPPEDVATATLEFGRELVVRSTGLPTLLVAPAA